jgi:uncharacterized YigZ family protein
MAESYLAPAAPASAELRERGSRFLALLLAAAGEAEAKARLAEVAAEHSGATHHCWAWRLGWPPRERSSDAGEPGGTAGPPILRALQGARVSDALLVVVRWYGGTKLGKGGLVRAYGGVAREVLRDAALTLRLRRQLVELEIPYPHLGAVQRLLHPPEIELLRQVYGEGVRWELAVADQRLPTLREVAAALGLRLRVAGEGGERPAGQDAGDAEGGEAPPGDGGG